MGELLYVCDRSWLLCFRRSNCFAHAIGCGFVSADGRAASLARSIVGCCLGWPRFGCAILDDCVWIRGLRSKSADPMFACAILGFLRQSSDPRFAQQNPRMVRIRTLRLTYIYIKKYAAICQICALLSDKNTYHTFLWLASGFNFSSEYWIF